jgi:hypothetical protein
MTIGNCFTKQKVEREKKIAKKQKKTIKYFWLIQVNRCSSGKPRGSVLSD